MRFFYPGTSAAAAATSVTLAASQRAALPDFVLPESVDLAVIEGAVLDADGRPMEGASMQLLRPAGEYRTPVGGPRVTSAAGRFHIAAPRGSTYLLSAVHRAGRDVRDLESAPFDLTADATIELRFPDR
jgi:hypothetical protein